MGLLSFIAPVEPKNSALGFSESVDGEMTYYGVVSNWRGSTKEGAQA